MFGKRFLEEAWEPGAGNNFGCCGGNFVEIGVRFGGMIGFRRAGFVGQVAHIPQQPIVGRGRNHCSLVLHCVRSHCYCWEGSNKHPPRFGGRLAGDHFLSHSAGGKRLVGHTFRTGQESWADCLRAFLVVTYYWQGLVAEKC